MGYFLIASGILFLMYYNSVVLYAGVGTSIIWIWLLAGITFVVLGGVNLYLKKNGITISIPSVVKWVGGLVLATGITMFLIGEVWIFSGMVQKGEPDLDYIVVLGCQVRGDYPSRALKERIDTAQAYLEKNPDTIAILSGGQGTGEHLSEAQCMYDWLVRAGIDGERLILEDKSTSTVENLNFSSQYLEKEKASVGVISNNFHIYRSVAIAKKQGYENVCGIAAPSRSILQPHYLVRECMALWKEKILKNI